MSNQLIKILIVDDEPAAGNILKLLIEKYVPGTKEIQYFNNPTEALQILSDYKPTLVMLDIEMPHLNGFDFLNLASETSFDVIFTTAFDKYAIKAIRFSALDYLLKPIDALELQNAINRHIVKRTAFNNEQQSQLVNNLLHNLKHKDPSTFKLAVSVKEGVFLYQLDEIVCLEGQNNYTKFYFTNKKNILVAKTLKEYEDILSDHNFLRVHKSFLVNRGYIKKLDSESTLWLINDITVPVSRRKKNELIEVFNNL
jgi:two-component system LytT family response regulator